MDQFVAATFTECVDRAISAGHGPGSVPFLHDAFEVLHVRTVAAVYKKTMSSAFAEGKIMQDLIQHSFVNPKYPILIPNVMPDGYDGSARAPYFDTVNNFVRLGSMPGDMRYFPVSWYWKFFSSKTAFHSSIAGGPILHYFSYQPHDNTFFALDMGIAEMLNFKDCYIHMNEHPVLQAIVETWMSLRGYLHVIVTDRANGGQRHEIVDDGVFATDKTARLIGLVQRKLGRPVSLLFNGQSQLHPNAVLGDFITTRAYRSVSAFPVTAIEPRKFTYFGRSIRRRQDFLHAYMTRKGCSKAFAEHKYNKAARLFA